MTKSLLPLLFYMSGILHSPEVNKTPAVINIYPDYVLVNDTEMCKPTGVETVIYTEAKPEAPPVASKAKKKNVLKASKKSLKKVQKKKA